MWHWILIHPVYDTLIVVGLLIIALTILDFLDFDWGMFFSDVVGNWGPIVLIVAVLGVAFLIFYFRSAIKNAAIAFFSLPNFWPVFWIVLGILAFLGLIVFIIRGWFEVGKAVGETVKGAVKVATTELPKPRTKSEVYTHEATGTVVHYEMKGKSLAEFLMKQMVAESKMGKILDTDPSAEMKDFESTLMVKVISQNKGSRRSKGGIYT